MNRFTRSIKKELTPGRIFTYLFVITLVAFTSLPIIYVISSAFKPLDELFLFPPRFFVRRPTMRNFGELLRAVDGSAVPFTRYIFNSAFVSLSVVALTIIVSSWGAYALTKLKFPRPSLVFSIIIAALMFSPHTTQITRYMVVNRLGWINTYWALIIPQIAVAYNLFLMKQFMEQIPDPLLECARMEGAGEFLIWRSIIMPLTSSAWATLAVFSFVSNWNDFFTPLIFTSRQAMRTLPLALQTIASSQIVARQGAMAAATLLMTMPTIVIFAAMQSRVMKSMAHSGIKA